jgi:probable O-glycosylation ligase (exosortase A-associated)
MILCAFSIIGSASRGAFLAVIAMGGFLVLKSRKRAVMILLLVILVPVGVAFAPQKYWDRMSTIETYKQDASAMGRINAWTAAINMANANPLTGLGFGAFTPYTFSIYAPIPDDVHDVHSIYFEVLGEQGWVGLMLYLTLLLMAYRMAGRTVRKAARFSEGTWHADLARMAQVCLVGYGVGGAFLGLAYYDLLYDIIAIVVLNHLVLDRILLQHPELAQTSGPNLMNGAQGVSAYGHVNKRVAGRD